MRALRIAVVAVVVLAVLLVTGTAGYYWFRQWQAEQEQAPLEAFYTPPEPLEGSPGVVIRSEPAPLWDVPGARAQRILYVTQGYDGGRRVSGGTVWIPERPARGPRKVVAWAHGTIGLGDQCAPSRNPAAMPLMSQWLQQMIANDWIVTATDYQGLGTPPPATYLLGRAEANDVVNSVRAARSMPGAEAGSDWAVYGLSQGGHAALWTGQLARDIAPELRLTAVAAAAPAGPLEVILAQQWDTAVAWAIGPEVMVSWPVVDPSLTPAAIVSDAGLAATEAQAEDCIMTAALFGLARQKLGQQYFDRSPLSDPNWLAALRTQTPDPLPADLPLLVPVGTEDNVVLPSSIAWLQRRWCRAGSDLTMDWMGGVDHIHAATVAGPQVVDWLDQRFAGKPTQPNCDQKPPVAPYRAK